MTASEASRQKMHLIRRSILQRLSLRIQMMKFGWTYIERGIGGGVENAVLKPFDSFAGCCVAAEEALNVESVRPVQLTQVVYCRYNGKQCIPEMQPVLKTFARHPSEKPRRS